MNYVFQGTDSGLLLYNSRKVPLSGTYNASPLSMAAGIATLGQLDKNVFEVLDENAQTLKIGFQKMASDFEFEAKATGFGSIFQFHFANEDVTTSQQVRRSNKLMRAYLDIALLNEGVYLKPSHFYVTSSATSGKDVRPTLQAIEKVFQELTPSTKKMVLAA